MVPHFAWFRKGRSGQSMAAAASEPGLDRTKNIGDVFLRLAALPTYPLDRLTRYEYMLWRQARQLVRTLETLRQATAELLMIYLFVARSYYSEKHPDVVSYAGRAPPRVRLC
jgi:hypothetical protein